MSFAPRPFALSSEAIAHPTAEDSLKGLALYLAYVKSFARSSIRLPAGCADLPLFSRWVEYSIGAGIAPLYTVSLTEFISSSRITPWLKSGLHLVIVIDQDLPALALEKIALHQPFLSQLTYVLVGKKDWRFKDAYRSFPAFARSRLYFDFPVSLSETDVFFAPAELTHLLQELELDFGLGPIRSFDPHFQLQTELLKASPTNIFAPGRLGEKEPALSIITTDAAVMEKLERSAAVKKYSDQIEIVIPMIAGQRVIPGIKDVPVFRSWLQLGEQTKKEAAPAEISAHLQNWGATHAAANDILFADLGGAIQIDDTLEKFFSVSETQREEISRAGHGWLVNREKFKRSGGFDPLYFLFGAGELEFMYRYWGGFNPASPAYEKLAAGLREKDHSPLYSLGLKLFFHQYFDFSFYRYFSEESTVRVSSDAEEERKTRLRNQLRYRVEQSRDRYLSLYNASPSVAIQGNLQILLYPYHAVKPYLWLLKMPIYPLFVQPYHWTKANVWYAKKIYYALEILGGYLMTILGKSWGIAIQPFHWLKKHAWYVKKVYHGVETLAGYLMTILGKAWGIAIQPFHFFRLHAWRVIIPFHFMRRHIWRVKYFYYGLHRAYYVLYELIYPIRKVYYFTEFQFQKRILKMHVKPSEIGGGR